MRKKKECSELFCSLNALVVEPNNALTPREILQQFGQGLATGYKEPSDDIYDDRHSDDELVDNVVEFEDEFEALEMMNQPMYPIEDVKNDEIETVKSQQDSESSSESSDEQLPGQTKLDV